VTRARLNIFLERDHAARIDELATMKRSSKSSIVGTAIAAFLSPEGHERLEKATLQRLRKIDDRLDGIERDQTILIEAFALYLLHHFSITAPVPEAHQGAARAQGRARFEQFAQQLARKLQRGATFAKDVTQ